MEGIHKFLINHGAQSVVGDIGDLADFVRGAEAIEEVDERHATFQSRGMGDGGHIGSFLRVSATKHGEAGGSAGHDVSVIAENGKPLSG